jgi:nucleotide-binding universal stress UspA family protein
MGLKMMEMFSWRGRVVWGGEALSYEYKKEAQKMMRANVEKKREELKTEIEAEWLKVSVKAVEGTPFREILEIAADEDVSLIVLGSHAKSNIREMLLGSVSEKVIRDSKQPVLVVKRDHNEHHS